MLMLLIKYVGLSFSVYSEIDMAETLDSTYVLLHVYIFIPFKQNLFNIEK